jgi:hypothetical protein
MFSAAKGNKTASPAPTCGVQLRASKNGAIQEPLGRDRRNGLKGWHELSLSLYPV